MHTVSIVGRPNVGKSALFNCLVGKRIAIVDSTYGLTRDRVFANVTHRGKRFTLIDSGGIDFDSSDGVREMARRQAELAIFQADLVLMVTDLITGLAPLDAEISALLRRAGKKVILVANKADNESLESGAGAFHKLGFEKLLAVSAAHARGISELLDEIREDIPEEASEESPAGVRIAVVGKPNVGKSSCVNRVLREERMIVHHVPGTTRDAVDTEVDWGGRRITLIDTAGLRRKGRTKEPVDFFSLSRTRAAVKRCDVALMLLSAVDEVSGVEEKLIRYILDHGRGCVLGINKWDLTRGVSKPEYTAYVRTRMPYLNFLPIVFLSAKTGYGIDHSLKAAVYVHEQAGKKIATPLLNTVLRGIWERNEPPIRAGKRCKFYYATQVGGPPPAFALFVNNDKLIQRRYESYLLNGIRRAFGFEGCPIRLVFKNRRPRRSR